MIEETRKETRWVIASGAREAVQRLNDPEAENVTVFHDPERAERTVADRYSFWEGYPIYKVTVEVETWHTSSTC